jgi:hypothetical protein
MRVTNNWAGQLTAAAMVAAALAVSLGPPAGLSAKTAAKAARHATHKGGSATASPSALVPFDGVCDTANVTDVLGDLTDADNKINQIALLQGRIIACSRKISVALEHLPTPTPQPYWLPAAPPPVQAPTPSPECVAPPNATTASNRFALFETLSRCFSYWTYLSTLPTPAPFDSPVPMLASQPTFYVFATGAADPVAAAVLIRSVVDRLIRAKQKAVASGLRVAARGDWTDPVSFAAQCQQDPNTRGALVIETAIPETYRHNYLLLTANFTNVSASLEMLGCGEQDHNPVTAPLSIWSEQSLTGSAHQTAVTLGILSSIATVFAKTMSTASVSTGGGTTTITQSTTQPPVLTGNALSYFQSQDLNLPAQNASVQLRLASERFADAAMLRLRTFCTAKEILSMAAAGDTASAPSAPPEHRTLPYKAASQYVADCGLFGNFVSR